MKISQLLRSHDDPNEELALPRNFGDAYLCRHNRIFRAVRASALNAGYAFSAEPGAAYLALPLSQLAAVLAEKRIPYTDNVGVLKQIETRLPGQVQWAQVCAGFKKNFVFHESCHAVARAIAEKIWLGGKDGVSADQLPRLLLEEAFANTCEFLGIMDAEDKAHEIFYEWNSYTALSESRPHLQRAAAEAGRERLARVILVGYLHANYLFDELDDGQFTRVLRWAGFREMPPPPLRKNLRALARTCFTLDDEFRNVTTGLYLRLNGVDSAGQLKKFDYFSRLESDPHYREYTDELIRHLR